MEINEWFAIGVIVGIPVGIVLGWIIAQLLGQQLGAKQPMGVMFERDEKGLIRAVIPVPSS